MKTYKEWRYRFTILDIGTSWRWVISFTPWLLYIQGNCFEYPLAKRLCGPQSQSGHCEEERNVFTLPGIKPCSLSLH
jgi:hypothetical protein